MKFVYTFIFMLLAVVACTRTEKAPEELIGSNAINEDKTKEILDHHWTAFKANDLEETMKDYAEESVLITPNATYSGLDEIRNNFVVAFKMFPKDSATFTLDKSIVVKDVGYILWKSKTPRFNLTYGTDTFVIRDGKIIRQTYAGVTE